MTYVKLVGVFLIALCGLNCTSNCSAAIQQPLTEDFGDTQVERAFDVTASQPRWFDELYFRAAIDGAKQPQDFGVNANLGGQVSMNWAAPIVASWGLGVQAGTGLTATGNAVRVYELLGESTGRTQHFTTVGLFQRTEAGIAWGLVYDFLNQKSFDQFQLGQWRGRLSYELTEQDQVGINLMLRSQKDLGVFGNSVTVELAPIDQMNFYWRRYWETVAQTTLWVGFSEGHGEDNVVTGFSPAKGTSFLLGADLLMPLNDRLAIYGETNLMMPADTGTVDAFLGLQWSPSRRIYTSRRTRFSPMQELAAPTTFSVDLTRQ